MSYSPSVSVVIAARNAQEYIEDTIKSALSQTYKVHEIIVVDDASSDDTAKIISELGNSKVRVLGQAKNIGQVAALNVGIANASGDIIALLDADDLWLPEKLELQIAATSRSVSEPSHPFLCFTAVEMFDDEGMSRVKPTRPIDDGDDLLDFLFLEGGIVQSSSIILSTSLAKNIGFDERVAKHSDLGLCVNVAATDAKIVCVPEPLTRWRQHRSGNASSTGADKTLEWSKLYMPLLGKRRNWGFLARHFVPKILTLDRWRGIHIVARAAIARSLSAREVASLTSRCLLPDQMYVHLKSRAFSKAIKK